MIFSAEAVADIASHREFWGSIDVELEKRWSALLGEALERVERAPLRYAARGPNAARRIQFAVGAQQYLIDYSVEGNEVVVVRVWHGRQDRPR